MRMARCEPLRLTIRPCLSIAARCWRHWSNAQTSAPPSTRCEANRLPIAPAPIMPTFMTVGLARQQARQVEHQAWDVGDAGQRQNENDQERDHLARVVAHRYLSNGADDEHVH